MSGFADRECGKLLWRDPKSHVELRAHFDQGDDFAVLRYWDCADGIWSSDQCFTVPRIVLPALASAA